MLVLAGVAWSLLFGPQLSGPRVAGTRTLGDPGFTLTAQERRGEALYAANCLSCHGGPTGGAMMDYPPKHNANGHTWHHSDCELVETVKTGGGPMVEMMREMMAPPGAPTMPAWREKLTDEEIGAVLAYIKLMWTPQERSVQAEITREQCSS
jgi:mono/diheme cytochrome c family protein